MITLLKTIIGFAVAFILLFPLTLVVGTVFEQVDIASNKYDTDIGTKVAGFNELYARVFMIVYAIWGISFIIFLLIAVKKSREELYG